MFFLKVVISADKLIQDFCGLAVLSIFGLVAVFLTELAICRHGDNYV